MQPATDIAFAFLQRHFPGHPDREELRLALAALVRAERRAAVEACAALAQDWFERLADHEQTFGTDLTSANTLRNLAAALRALPLGDE
jgi:hypothetical protein